MLNPADFRSIESTINAALLRERTRIADAIESRLARVDGPVHAAMVEVIEAMRGEK